MGVCRSLIHPRHKSGPAGSTYWTGGKNMCKTHAISAQGVKPGSGNKLFTINSQIQVQVLSYYPDNIGLIGDFSWTMIRPFGF